MSDETVNDLKQFILATISQQLSQQTEGSTADMQNLEERLTKKLEYNFVKLNEKIESSTIKLDEKIDDLSLSIAKAIDNSNDAVAHQLKDHESRINRLESRTV